MKRDDILDRAEKYGVMTAGWIFSAPGLEKFWRDGYEAGRRAEKRELAKYIKQLESVIHPEQLKNIRGNA